MKTKSFLFVPSIKNDRFDKALNSGADYIIIDLEDSISPNQKDKGRANILEFANNTDANFFIRINDTKSEYFNDDMKLLDELNKMKKLYAIVLPKSESSKEFELFKDFKDLIIIPIIESALGVDNLDDIASSKLIKLLSFGALDISLELGLKEGSGRENLLNHIRNQIVIKSAKYKLLPPINGVYPDIKDEIGLKSELEFVSSMGFGGSLSIHPNQIPIINQVFSPTKEQILWAKEIVELAKNTDDIVFNYKGNMIDLPVIKKAQNILANI